MPTALAHGLSVPPAGPPRKRWTRKEVEFLEGSGLFDGQRYELVAGELISKMGINRPSVLALVRVQQQLAAVFGADRLQTQAPIDVAPEDNPTSEPQPDACVTARTAFAYPDSSPGASDVLLLVEVSDTTLQHDTTIRPRSTRARGSAITGWWIWRGGACWCIGRRRTACTG